jgi:uncharacterized protein YacL
MTPTRTINLLRGLFLILACFVGATVGGEIFKSQFVGVGVGLIFGLTIVLADRLLKGISLRIFSSSTFGLLMGFLAARLFLASDILKYLPEDSGWGLSLAIYAAAGYLGMMLAMRSNSDEFSLIIPYVRFHRTAVQDASLVVDTNIILDGRVRDLCASGFLSRSLVVPRLVLDELQRLADSGDAAKRETGRRGLDLLAEMRKDPNLNVTIHESATDAEAAVDAKLVHLAQLLHARLLTNDSGLAKIARLQNVTVLNLNELAKAMKPAVAAGDYVDLALVKEGREPHQAVGYLQDGTMVVVNHARSQLGKTVTVTVGAALQTAAGRMFFAELRQA